MYDPAVSSSSGHRTGNPKRSSRSRSALIRPAGTFSRGEKGSVSPVWVYVFGPSVCADCVWVQSTLATSFSPPGRRWPKAG